jgi:hypothetical protein
MSKETSKIILNKIIDINNIKHTMLLLLDQKNFHRLKLIPELSNLYNTLNDFNLETLINNCKKFSLFDDITSVVDLLEEANEFTLEVKSSLGKASLFLNIDVGCSNLSKFEFRLNQSSYSGEESKEKLLNDGSKLIKMFKQIESKEIKEFDNLTNALSEQDHLNMKKNNETRNRINNINEKINFISYNVTKFKENLTKIIDEVNNLKKESFRNETLLNTVFNPGYPVSESIICSNNNRTIKIKENSEDKVPYLRTVDRIPESGSHEIRFRIDYIIDSYSSPALSMALIGPNVIQPNGLDVDEESESIWGVSWGEELNYSENGKKIFEKHFFFDLENYHMKSGDEFSLCINMDENLIYCKFNGEICTVKKRINNLDSTRKTDLYALIYFEDNGVQFSLV